MIRPAFALGLMLTALASPAFAQDWPADMRPEGAVARLVEAAMPMTEYDWALRWSAFGTRVGQAGARWHLHDPGSRTRNGWASVNGRTMGISLQGDDEQVAAMSIEVSDLWVGLADVLEELAEVGVSATPLPVPTPAPPPPEWADDHYRRLVGRYPPHRAWRLEKAGREPSRLDARWICSPPRTRNATRCEMTWTVSFATQRQSQS